MTKVLLSLISRRFRRDHEKHDKFSGTGYLWLKAHLIFSFHSVIHSIRRFTNSLLLENFSNYVLIWNKSFDWKLNFENSAKVFMFSIVKYKLSEKRAENLGNWKTLSYHKLIQGFQWEYLFSTLTMLVISLISPVSTSVGKCLSSYKRNNYERLLIRQVKGLRKIYRLNWNEKYWVTLKILLWSGVNKGLIS